MVNRLGISIVAFACLWPPSAQADDPPPTAIDNADSPAPPVPSTFRDAVPEEYRFEFDASLDEVDQRRANAEATSTDRLDGAADESNQVAAGRLPQLTGRITYQPISSSAVADQPRPFGRPPQSPLLRRVIAICAAGLSLAAWLLIALRSLKPARTAPPRLS